jgi:hypothetical protein
MLSKKRLEEVEEYLRISNKEHNEWRSFINGVTFADICPKEGMIDIDLICNWLIINHSKFLLNDNGKAVFNIDQCIYNLKRYSDALDKGRRANAVKPTIKIIE